jgi:hypothetical protein
VFVPLLAALGGGIGWLVISQADDVVPPASSQ